MLRTLPSPDGMILACVKCARAGLVAAMGPPDASGTTATVVSPFLLLHPLWGVGDRPLRSWSRSIATRASRSDGYSTSRNCFRGRPPPLGARRGQSDGRSYPAYRTAMTRKSSRHLLVPPTFTCPDRALAF